MNFAIELATTLFWAGIGTAAAVAGLLLVWLALIFIWNVGVGALTVLTDYLAKRK